jgi:hypothetical protein
VFYILNLSTFTLEMTANTKMVLIAMDRYEELTSSTGRVDNKNPNKSVHKERGDEASNTDGCDENLTDDNILDFIPSDYHKKAKLILRHLKTHSIKWDSCGRLVLDNDCVVNANIIEIIKDVVSMNNNKIESTASKHFYKLLILTQFPVSLLNLHDGSNTVTGGEKNSEKSLL